MKKIITFCCLCMAFSCLANDTQSDNKNVTVVIKTTLGDFQVQLNAEKAPITVANFLSYVDEDGYADTIFHRVIEGFMIQGGGMRVNMRAVTEHKGIYNEADNGLRNVTGTIAMARLNEIDTAQRQFFINVNNNAFLDHSEASCTREDEQKQKAATARGLYRPQSCKTFGYVVFGHVVKGMENVRRIEFEPTVNRNGHQNVPVIPVTIIKIERL
ncbi:MAG: peptidylprolyl isomerase [bacterium]